MVTRCWLLALALGLGALVAAPAAEARKADAERIAKLVKQLGSDSREDVEKATKELEEIGAPALGALREAAKDGDGDVKSRAEALVKKVETKAAADKLLAPTKVKLVFKETPLADAIAEFNKKSGYTIVLHDPHKKLKERTVTLDTGEVTFWEAFDKFCEKADLVEGTMQGPGGGLAPPPDQRVPVKPPSPEKKEPPGRTTPPREKKEDGEKDEAPAARPAPVQVGGFGGGPGGGFAPGFMPIAGFLPQGTIVVVDGKPKSVPTCYAGAVRIRALKEGPNFGFGGPFAPPGGPAAKDDLALVWLEVRAEPKVQLQFLQSVAVEKATDDKDQKLEMAKPPAGAPPGFGPGGGPAPGPRPAFAPLGGGFGGGFGGFGMGGFGDTQHYPVPLKKGEKEAKALKEFAGTIKAHVLTPAEPLITADKITKAAGETFKGKDGGQIKVTDVKEDDGKITIKFELEMPKDVITPTTGPIGIPGGVPPIKGLPLPLPREKPARPDGANPFFQAPAPPAPAEQPPVPFPPGGAPPGLGFPGFAGFPAPGVTLVDDKGKTIPQTGGAPPKGQFTPGKPPIVEFTQEYKLDKDQKPAKLVFSGSKMATVEIPFSFKDVPLK
ncbi:MAG TPA: hypothetical protein VKA46_22255 [Gemmataceae bacterium]|nr:hypothetical protein [Gemmataceae bacterium]